MTVATVTSVVLASALASAIANVVLQSPVHPPDAPTAHPWPAKTRHHARNGLRRTASGRASGQPLHAAARSRRVTAASAGLSEIPWHWLALTSWEQRSIRYSLALLVADQPRP